MTHQEASLFARPKYKVGSHEYVAVLGYFDVDLSVSVLRVLPHS